MWTLATYWDPTATANGSTPKRTNPQLSYSATAGTLASVTVSWTTLTPGRSRACVRRGFDKSSPDALAPPTRADVHAEEGGLVTDLLPLLERQADDAREFASIEVAEDESYAQQARH